MGFFAWIFTSYGTYLPSLALCQWAKWPAPGHQNSSSSGSPPGVPVPALGREAYSSREWSSSECHQTKSHCLPHYLHLVTKKKVKTFKMFKDLYMWRVSSLKEWCLQCLNHHFFPLKILKVYLINILPLIFTCVFDFPWSWFTVFQLIIYIVQSQTMRSLCIPSAV